MTHSVAVGLFVAGIYLVPGIEKMDETTSCQKWQLSKTAMAMRLNLKKVDP
jgi:hypothetical protein